MTEESTCPVCGQATYLTLVGTLPVHGPGPSWWPGVNCPGSCWTPHLAARINLETVKRYCPIACMAVGWED